MSSTPKIHVVTFPQKLMGVEPMRMRLRKGRWYTNLRNPLDPSRKLEITLKAYKHESAKAQINLARILVDLERGIDPVSVRQRFSKIKLKGAIDGRTEQVLRTHVYPFFGQYKPREITKEIIEKYFEYRFGLDKSGGLQATNTIEKELRVFKRIMRMVDNRYELPKIRYKTIKRKILDPLTYEQIIKTLKHLDQKYAPVYWIMVYTGMDVSDAVNLKPKHFTKDGWIDKPRGKVEGANICVPVHNQLRKILKVVPYPLDPDSILFPDIKPKAVTTAIIRAFKNTGLQGYGAKYLRRFVASLLLDEGYSHDWIGKALAHAEGSKITKRYTKVYRKTLGEAFAKIGSVG